MQRGCLEVFAAYGYRVWRIGQYNAARTQDAGPADLYAAHPLDGLLWCECKRPVGGRWPKAQQEFAEAVVAGGGLYVKISDPKALAETLAAIRRERIARTMRTPADRNGVDPLTRTDSR